MSKRSLLGGLLVVVIVLGSALGRAQQSPSPTSQVTEPVLEEIKTIERKMVAVAEDFPERLYNTYRPNGKKDLDTAADILLGIADFNATGAFQFSTKQQQAAIAGAGNVPDDRNFVYVSKQDTVRKVKESFAAVRKAIQDNPDPNNLQDWLFIISSSCQEYGRLVTYYHNNGLVPPKVQH